MIKPLKKKRFCNQMQPHFSIQNISHYSNSQLYILYLNSNKKE